MAFAATHPRFHFSGVPTSRTPPPTPPLYYFPLSTTCSNRGCSPSSSSLCCRATASITILQADGKPESVSEITKRSVIRLGLPSKGRMAEETLHLLKNCQLSVRQVNPRQYVADIPQLPNLEVWFQRPKDIVRKLVSGDLDLGIVGLDTVSEHGQGNEDLVIVHDDLQFGDCHLSIAIPNYGIFENINSLDELAQMPRWTKERPLRITTGFTYLGKKFAYEKGLKHVTFSTADGALEAAPAMGIADAILDLVSSGTTLRENNLKEIEGGVVLESQGVLVGSKKSMIQRKGVLDITHEMLERLEAHLRAIGQFQVVANMRGNSAKEIAEKVLSQSLLSGLQGPTISPVYCKHDGIKVDYYAIVICVPRNSLYNAVQQLRSTMKQIGGGFERNGLYYLQPFTSTPTIAATTTLFQLHQGFGHPNVSVLRRQFPQVTEDMPFRCEACQLGKHHRSFSVRQGRKAHKPFELVHANLWDLCCVSSIRGFMFFLCIVDDYSRVCWVFMLKK